jgi:hypothetical protein
MTQFREIADIIKTDSESAIREKFSSQPALLTVETPFGTWLKYAARFGKANAVRCLVELGADVNAEGRDDGGAVQDAAANGHLAILRFLIKNGARLDVDVPEKSPLLSAIFNRQFEATACLAEAGINLHTVFRAEDGGLKNALSHAMAYGSPEIVEFLKSRGCRVPVEGLDAPQLIAAPSHSSTWTKQQAIIEFMQECFGPVDELALTEVVPVLDSLHVTVHVIQPDFNNPFLVLFTTGMSDREMVTPSGQESFARAELVMLLPADWTHPRSAHASASSRWPVEWLRQVAYYPHVNRTWLGNPCSIISNEEPPEPLGPGTDQSCLLAIPDLKQLKPLQLPDKSLIHFYTLVPLYKEERDYELRNGAFPFLEWFMKQRIPIVVDPTRPKAGLNPV